MLFVVVGVLMVVYGEVAVGSAGALLGLGGVGAYVLDRARRRGDPRAGGVHEPHTRGPYLLLGGALGGMFAAIGVICLVFTPVTKYRGWVRTPTDARVLGAIALVFGLVIIAVAITRWVRTRRSQPIDQR
ncbi:hypothetical protein AOZ06_04015 [Kibdelosporangium phytohabitans]|uniref:Uncharacterized protein n=1 Tax=Kibdelosporangium phytohabitans TaxID=860235 RepID=A0A0N9HVS1_9PSEU|nr:hypothetical protein AOZ06_04015 [Kibdelosporangium phytohabitans]